MKLWLLRPVTRWSEYDTAHGFVVRAENESEARAFAAQQGGDESLRDDWDDAAERWTFHYDAWSDTGVTTCVELPLGGDPGVVLRDFNAG